MSDFLLLLLLVQRFGGHVKNFSFKKRSRPFAYHGEANTAVSHDTPSFFRAPHTQVIVVFLRIPPSLS